MFRPSGTTPGHALEWARLILQLYALGKASFTVGALTMLAFALGTLPALLSLSAVSGLAKGAFQKHFLRFAGAAVILLGIFNIQYGLVLTGSEVARPATANSGAVAAELEHRSRKRARASARPAWRTRSSPISHRVAAQAFSPAPTR